MYVMSEIEVLSMRQIPSTIFTLFVLLPYIVSQCNARIVVFLVTQCSIQAMLIGVHHLYTK